MKTVDASVSFIDQQNKRHSSPEEIPTGEAYTNAFPIEATYRKEGYLYVKCYMTSEVPLSKFKHGEQNIMEFLRVNNLFVQTRKFMSVEQTKPDKFHPVWV